AVVHSAWKSGGDAVALPPEALIGYPNRVSDVPRRAPWQSATGLSSPAPTLTAPPSASGAATTSVRTAGPAKPATSAACAAPPAADTSPRAPAPPYSAAT